MQFLQLPMGSTSKVVKFWFGLSSKPVSHKQFTQNCWNWRTISEIFIKFYISFLNQTPFMLCEEYHESGAGTMNVGLCENLLENSNSAVICNILLTNTVLHSSQSALLPSFPKS